MKKQSIRVVGLLMAAMLVVSSFSMAYGKRKVHTLSVVSYNIRHGEGIDGKTDYARIARHFINQKADVVAVQEVDSVTGRSGGEYVLARLSECSGLYPTFAKAIAFDGGSYGIGILSKEQPVSVRRVRLPGREEERVLLMAEFKDYIFACLHLSLTPEDQLASVPIILENVKGACKPFILAGDWNALPSDAFVAEMRQMFFLVNDTTQPTYPADTPDSLLDYIAVCAPSETKVQVDRFTVIADSVSSDHRPIAARLSWKGK